VSERAEVVVLGLGPGGEAAAGDLAEAGLDVVGIDGGLVGGECPYWGCIPSKMMIRASNLLAEGRRIPGMAGESSITPDWDPVARRIRDDATDNWNDRAAVRRLEARGARFVRGWASFTGPHQVVVGDREIEATRAILLNPGSKPWSPPISGLAETPYWTNHQAIEADSLPSSIIALGGGAIGLELAQVFARFGAEVTVVEAADRLLAVEEPESSRLIAEIFAEEGVSVVTGVKITRVSFADGQFTVDLDGRDPVRAEKLLVATGRRSDLAALGVAAIGLDETARAISVDGRMRAAPGVWAIGDVTGVGAFTHVSMYQSRIATADILGREVDEADYRALPRVTFTDPEIGSVGLSEASAVKQGLRVRTGVYQVPDSTRGWIHKVGNRGFIKLVEDAEQGVLVGATSAGPVGGEVLSFLVLAVQARVPTKALREMMYAYPTFHRAIEAALGELER
jgi:pyruvate/2-oxoglutarate dehydrogenase complex dihydrolipoamide dehydrogenase (E3) component